ncbi:MAG: hypothetical protein WC375_03640 [Methanomassiliicoccales archaeon]|jgi:hypothetical protein
METNSATKVTEQVIKLTGDSPFIEETDQFDVTVTYYRKGIDVVVDGISENFDANVPSSTATFTFKCVSCGDSEVIGNMVGHKKMGLAEHMSLRDLMEMEFARLMALIRKWSFPEELNNENILKLPVKIIKKLHFELRERLGMDGII